MAVVKEEVKFQRKKKGKSFLQKAKKFGKQGQRGRGSQIAQVSTFVIGGFFTAVSGPV